MPSTAPACASRQPALLDDLVDLQRALRLQQLLLRIGQAEIGKHIASYCALGDLTNLAVLICYRVPLDGNGKA
jgi:hypothetical protein